jgi:hypothetical protein
MSIGRNRAALIIIIPLLLACQPPASRIADAEFAAQSAQARSQIEQYVGKDYWIKFGSRFQVYASPDKTSPSSTLYGKIRIEAFVKKEDDYDFWYRVTYETNQSGFVDISTSWLRYALQDHDPFADAIYPSFIGPNDKRRSKQGVLIGMNKSQVLLTAWGKPERTREIHESKSQREEWYYPDGNALFFENDRLYATASDANGRNDLRVHRR